MFTLLSYRVLKRLATFSLKMKYHSNKIKLYVILLGKFLLQMWVMQCNSI